MKDRCVHFYFIFITFTFIEIKSEILTKITFSNLIVGIEDHIFSDLEKNEISNIPKFNPSHNI